MIRSFLEEKVDETSHSHYDESHEEVRSEPEPDRLGQLKVEHGHVDEDGDDELKENHVGKS